MFARICRLGAVLVFALLGSAVASSAQASAAGTGTYLQMTSQPGDWIGKGLTYAYSPGNGQFSSLIQYGYVADIEIATSNPGEWWSLWLGSPDKGKLAPGTYLGAVSSVSLGQPYISVSGSGRGCTASGQFTVLEVSYDAAGKVALLDATFSQTCQGSSAALTGEVRYVAPPAVNPAPSVNVSVSDAARTGGTLSLSLGAFSDGGGDAAGPWQVHVDWGDASSDDFVATTQGALGVRAHKYPVTAAVYQAAVVVTNQRGASARATFAVSESASPRVGSFLSLVGQSGDYVVGNRTVNLASGATYSAKLLYSYGIQISAQSSDSSESWTLDFTSPDHAKLVPGVYANASRAALAPLGQAGLDVFGDGRGCNQVAGTFTVLQAVYGPDGAPVLFDATFSESCETWMPPFTGEIRYVASTWTTPVLSVTAQTYSESDSKAGVYSINLGTLTDTSLSASGYYGLVVGWGDGTFDTYTVSLGQITPRGHLYAKPGTYVVTVQATSPAGYSTASSFNLTLNNVAPTVSTVRYDGAAAPAAIGTSIAFAADFLDPGTGETYTATFDWGDGSGSIGTISAGVPPSGWTARASHSYSKPGLYVVKATVSDGLGSGTATLQNVVVYSPASTVTGKGSVVSPAGACRLSTSCSRSGTATFNIDGRYYKVAPSASFSFSATGFSLNASQADWLVSSNKTATMRGKCTVNGHAGYIYLLTAVDGTSDGLRLQVWDAGGVLVYDNGGTTKIKSGSIVVK